MTSDGHAGPMAPAQGSVMSELDALARHRSLAALEWAPLTGEIAVLTDTSADVSARFGRALATRLADAVTDAFLSGDVGRTRALAARVLADRRLE